MKSLIRLTTVFMLLGGSSVYAQTVTPATGGSAISADLAASGTYVTLTGPVYSEVASGNAGVGTIILNAPSGFIFDVGGTAPTVRVNRLFGSGNNSRNINGLADGGSFAITSITTTQLTITISTASNNGVFCSLTWLNVRVRPSAGTPLASGNITKTGTSSMAGVTGTTNFGTLTEVVGAANKLNLQTQPASSATAGVVFAQQPVVRIEDQFGNLRSTDTLTITASRSTGTGTLQGTVSRQAVAGVATYTNLSYNVAETMNIRFSRSGLVPDTSNNVVVSPSAFSKVGFTTEPGSATAGSSFGIQPVVRSQDQFGNNSTIGLGSSVIVTLTLVSGSGPLQGTASLDIGTGAGNGTASFTDLRIDSAGIKRIRAGAPSVTPDTSVSFSVNPAAATRLTIQTSPPSSATAGTAFSTQPVIRVEDQFGNLRTSDNTTNVTAVVDSGLGTLQGTTTRQAVGGVVTYANLSHNIANNIKLKFRTSGLDSAFSNTIAVGPAAASKLTILTQPSSTATAGVVFAQQPQIRIEDAFGNLRTGDNSTLVTAARSVGSGTLQGTLTATASSGVASFASLFHTVATKITIAFSATSLTGTTSDTVNIGATAVKRLGFAQQPGGATVYSVFQIPPIVVSQDSFGNPSTLNLPASLPVTVSLVAGTGPLMGTTTLDIGTSAGNGTITFNTLRIDVAGTDKRLKATASGLDSALSSIFTVNNPLASLSSISPSSRTARDTGFTMTVNGHNFVPASVVRVGLASRTTTFGDSTQVTAQLLASDIDTSGAFSITVFNPTPGGGTSGSQPLTVVKRTTTTSVAADTNPSIFGHAVTFTATVTPSIGVAFPATGTVEFFDSLTSLGTSTLSGGIATRSVSSLSVGSHSIRATYRGDTSSTTSTSSPITQTVNKAPTITTVASNNNPSVYGQSVTFTATVSPSSATGTVEFFDSTTSLGTSTLSGGIATRATSALNGGTHPITAVYLGNTSYLSSTSSVLTQTVNKASSSVSLASNKNPATRTDSVRFTATVTPSTATGTVDFRDSLTTIGTAPVSGGTAIFMTNALAHGNHPMTAVYSGSINYNGSTSSTLVQSVKDSSTVTVVSNLNPSAYLDSVTFTATVSPVDSVTGSVQFKDGAANLGSPVALSAGIAKLKIAALGAGTHTISAVYSGDVKYFGKTSPNLTQTVNKRQPTTLLTSSLNPSFYGDSVRFTATLTPGAPTGQVTFYDSLTSLGNVTLVGGIASLVRTNLTAKTHRIRVTYPGDANYFSGADSLQQVVNKAIALVVLTSNLNPSGYGEQVTFTATVTPSIATGNVQFFDSTTSLGTSSLTSGIATLSTSALAKRLHPVTAQYSGDANVNAGTSAILYQDVIILSNGNFEKGRGFAANGWTVVNGSQMNEWSADTAAKNGGTYGAYISNDGGAHNQYTVSDPTGFGAIVHFYKDVTFPAGESSIKLKFDWRSVGQGGTVPVDYMKVSLGPPDSLTPSEGVELGEFYQIGGSFLLQSTWRSDSIMIEGSNAGTTGRLVFTWVNNDASGTQPPAAIDNIFITSRVPNPLTGVKTIGPGGNYTSFTAAIADLNTNGVGAGGVTFNVTSGTTFIEDPPAVVASGAIGSPILFQKSGGGANPVIRPTGSTSLADFGFCISGGDYITVDGVDITINSGFAVEYGYLVRNRSTLNGAQNNLVKNCRVTLNRSNTSSYGILQVVGTAGGAGGFPASSAGANSLNKYFNITIENCYGGIWLQGDFVYSDQNCEVGVTGGGSTTIGAATASDIGNSGTSVFGIRAQNQTAVKIFNSTVRNLTTTGNSTSTSCNGIYIDNCFGTSLVYNNIIFSLTKNNTGLNGVISGIRTELTSGNSIVAYNNVIHSLNTANIVSPTANLILRGISHNTSSGLSGTGNYYFNSIRIDQGGALNASSTALWCGGGTVNYQNNILSNFTGTQSGVAKHYAIYISAGGVGVASNNILYTANANGFVGFNGTDRSSLQLWTAAISDAPPSDGKESGSASADPNFVSATDLTFAGATPAANSGMPITTPNITQDILGNAGNRTTTPDIGAYETSAALNDQTAPAISNVIVVSGVNPSVTATIADNSRASVNAIVRLWYRAQGSGGVFTALDANTKPAGAMNGTYAWTTAISSLAPATYEFYIAARDSGTAGSRIAMNPMWATGFAGFSATDPPNYVNNPALYANVRTVVVDLTVVRVKLFLEGAYEGADSMRTALRSSGQLASHFGAIPIPSQAVDSINIEIRDSAAAGSATVRMFAPAWLMHDGTIRGFTDTSKTSIGFNVVSGDYYVVVRHRNHLAIMSSTKLPLSSSSSLHDFSTSATQAYLGGQKQVGTSPVRYGMIAGNVDGNTGIGASDIVQVRGIVGSTGYLIEDVDLNSGVGASDIVMTRANVGQTTQVP